MHEQFSPLLCLVWGSMMGSGQVSGAQVYLTGKGSPGYKLGMAAHDYLGGWSEFQVWARAQDYPPGRHGSRGQSQKRSPPQPPSDTTNGAVLTGHIADIEVNVCGRANMNNKSYLCVPWNIRIYHWIYYWIPFILPSHWSTNLALFNAVYIGRIIFF